MTNSYGIIYWIKADHYALIGKIESGMSLRVEWV